MNVELLRRPCVLALLLGLSAGVSSCREQGGAGARHSCEASYVRANARELVAYLVGCSEEIRGISPAVAGRVAEIIGPGLAVDLASPSSSLGALNERLVSLGSPPVLLNALLDRNGRTHWIGDSRFGFLRKRSALCQVTLFGGREELDELSHAETRRALAAVDGELEVQSFGVLGRIGEIEFRRDLTRKLNRRIGRLVVDDLALDSCVFFDRGT